jgi:hypothetical protein
MNYLVEASKNQEKKLVFRARLITGPNCVRIDVVHPPPTIDDRLHPCLPALSHAKILNKRSLNNYDAIALLHATLRILCEPDFIKTESRLAASVAL